MELFRGKKERVTIRNSNIIQERRERTSLYQPNNLNQSFSRFLPRASSPDSQYLVVSNVIERNTQSYDRVENSSQKGLQKPKTEKKKNQRRGKVIRRIDTSHPIKSSKKPRTGKKQLPPSQKKNTKKIKILSKNKFQIDSGDYVIEDINSLKLGNETDLAKTTENICSDLKLDDELQVIKELSSKKNKKKNGKNKSKSLIRKAKKKRGKKKPKSSKIGSKKGTISVRFESKKIGGKNKKKGVKQFASSNTSYSARLRRGGDIEDYMEVIDDEIENIHKKIDKIMSNLMSSKMMININQNGQGEGKDSLRGSQSQKPRSDEEGANGVGDGDNQKAGIMGKGLNDGNSQNNQLQQLLKAKSNLSKIREIIYPPRVTSIVRTSYEPIGMGTPPVFLSHSQILHPINPPLVASTRLGSSQITFFDTPIVSSDIQKSNQRRANQRMSVNNFNLRPYEEEKIEDFDGIRFKKARNHSKDIKHRESGKFGTQSHVSQGKQIIPGPKFERKSGPSKYISLENERADSAPSPKLAKKPRKKAKKKNKKPIDNLPQEEKKNEGSPKDVEDPHFFSSLNPYLNNRRAKSNRSRLNKKSLNPDQKRKLAQFSSRIAEELNECTFKPKINKRNAFKTNLTFEERQKRWFKGKEYHKRKMMKKAFRDLTESCTFKPETNIKKEEKP